MRERSQTTPRRRRSGPKQPLPKSRYDDVGAQESPYYTIDNTEDIYGTTLLPSQRCYVDPWDLENYDYVRKKLDDGLPAANNVDYEPPEEQQYANSLTPSPTAALGYAGYGMSATMPRPHTRRLSRAQCRLDCCVPLNMNRKEPLYAARSELYGLPVPAAVNRYDDYMATMTRQLHLDEQLDNELLYGEQPPLYNGYGGLSNASSAEQQHSSIGDELPLPRRAVTLQRPRTASQPNYNKNYGYGTAPHPRRKRSAARSNAKLSSPHIEFPVPPPLSPAYDYCNPYTTHPYCSLPDCQECQQNATSIIYAAPSTLYGTLGAGRRAQCGSPHSADAESSLYAGIYARKFGLSKKGLLQIDYSCSWDDLDRVMGRQF